MMDKDVYKATLQTKIEEMWRRFEIKRGTARFNEEADYWEGAMDAAKWIQNHIKRGDWDED
jgi:hypothetical protein